MKDITWHIVSVQWTEATIRIQLLLSQAHYVPCLPPDGILPQTPALVLTCPTPHDLNLPDTPALQVLTTKYSLQPWLPWALSLSDWPGIASFGVRISSLSPCVHWVVQVLGLFPSYLKKRKQQWLLSGPVAAQGGQCCKFRNVFGLRLGMEQDFRSDSYQPGFLETGMGARPIYSFAARNRTTQGWDCWGQHRVPVGNLQGKFMGYLVKIESEPSILRDSEAWRVLGPQHHAPLQWPAGLSD